MFLCFLQKLKAFNQNICFNKAVSALLCRVSLKDKWRRILPGTTKWLMKTDMEGKGRWRWILTDSWAITRKLRWNKQPVEKLVCNWESLESSFASNKEGQAPLHTYSMPATPRVHRALAAWITHWECLPSLHRRGTPEPLARMKSELLSLASYAWACGPPSPNPFDHENKCAGGHQRSTVASVTLSQIRPMLRRDAAKWLPPTIP